MRCVAADLILILAAAIAGSIAFSGVFAKTLLAWTSAILAGFGLILTILIRTKTFEQDWYDGRAIAESIKTRTWRFVTKSDPYHQTDTDIETKFISDLHEVANERKQFTASLGGSLANKKLVSDRMREIRELPFVDRKALYVQDRIIDQRDWYANKSTSSRRVGNIWFAGILVAQALMLFACYAMIQWPEIPVNVIGVLSALSAGLVAWNQLRRHQELANTYGLAAEELSVIAELSEHIINEAAFSQFVLDAENAISREHTLWKARRDKV